MGIWVSQQTEQNSSWLHHGHKETIAQIKWRQLPPSESEAVRPYPPLAEQEGDGSDSG